MPKNIFFKSTLILLIGGFFTKILGLIIKIIFTRILKEPGIALYSLIMPTYSLLISLANFNIQLSISKRISANKRSKKTIINACYIMLILNIILIKKAGLLYLQSKHRRYCSPSLLQTSLFSFPYTT